MHINFNGFYAFAYGYLNTFKNVKLRWDCYLHGQDLNYSNFKLTVSYLIFINSKRSLNIVVMQF